MTKIFILGLFFLYFLFFPIPVRAQSLDPNIWQAQATGLKTQLNSDKKTGGLSFLITAENWPRLAIHGGVHDAGWGKVNGPIDIDLGQITIPSITTSSLSSETGDWSGSQLIFNSSTNTPLTIMSSRLSGAIAVKSPSQSIQLLTGNVATFFIYSGGETTRNQPSYPKYIAYSTGGTIQIKQLSSSIINLPQLDNNWLLIWYGDASHFQETKEPLIHPDLVKKVCCESQASVPTDHSYKADSPILIKFKNNPYTIKNASQGGIELGFNAQMENITLIPLLGINHLRSSETEGWKNGLPDNIKQKISLWSERLCWFPKSVRESYNYNPATDTAVMTENVNFEEICPNGIKTATLPPFLALAKQPLNVSFSPLPSNLNYPTVFGPLWGIDNITTYSWQVSGLAKYIDGSRILGQGSVPSEIISRLSEETDKLTNAGHLAPWLYMDKWPYNGSVGSIFYINPAEVLNILSEIIPVLPETQKTQLMNYLKNEKNSYNPENIFNLPLYNGTKRKYFNPEDQDAGKYFEIQKPELFSQRVWLFNYYSLFKYYQVTNEVIPDSLITTLKTVFAKDQQEIDWASMYWFSGFADRLIPVVNLNRHLAGLIGTANLAKNKQDTSLEQLARVLFAKAAVSRLAMAIYPQYLYSENLVELPTDPAWQPKVTSDVGSLYVYNWQSSNDDVRQVAILNQTELILMDNSGYREGDTQRYSTSPYLIPFRDLVPSVARLLADKVKTQTDIYVSKVDTIFPHWYSAYTDALLGEEHGNTQPIDSYQLFLAKAWINNNPGSQLEKFVDIPWLETGDLFYIHKLAETAKAYQGWTWADESTEPSPTPRSCPTNLNTDNVTNLGDLTMVISKWGQTGDIPEDIDNSGTVNLVDLNMVLSKWGQTCQ